MTPMCGGLVLARQAFALPGHAVVPLSMTRVEEDYRREADRPVHDPQPHPRREAAPGGGLVTAAMSAIQ
jgi:hypothetical protein